MDNKKRKIDHENRSFNNEWELKYFFINEREKAICLICNQSVAVFKVSNIKRHYDSLHGKSYDKFSGFLREEKLSEMKNKLKIQQNIFTKHKSLSEKSLKASFVITQMIVKNNKPFTEGEFIKDCILESCNLICPEKKHLFADISLSKDTVMRRTEKLSENLKQQLIDISKQFEFYSLALDESIDIKDISQLSIFIRGVNKKFEIHEELLKVKAIYGTTKGKDIFNSLKEVLIEHQLTLNNLICVTTDGCPSMIGKNVGLVALIKQELNELNPNNMLFNYHCIIHQESLCAKSANIKEVMNFVVKIVNLIRNSPLSHRKFQDLLKELNSQYGDVIYWSNIRWLSKGKVLKRFYELKNEIILFLSEKNYKIDEISDPKFNFDLAFLIDLTQYLNELNVKLQGRDNLITELYSHIKAFETKLNLFHLQLKNSNYAHFETCKQVMQEFDSFKFSSESHSIIIQELLTNFEERFGDFRKNKFQFDLFKNPFNIEVSESPEEIQLELIEFQSNDLIEMKFKELNLIEFYRYLENAYEKSYLKIKENAHKIISMFGSTYLCEQLFSSLKSKKSKQRNQISDNHLNDCMKIFSAKSLSPNIDKIVSEMQCQTSH